MIGSIVTVEKAAELLKVPKGTIRLWIRKGKLKAAKLPNGEYRIQEKELERILEGGQTG